MTFARWTARCKSGYLWRSDQGKLIPCTTFTPRGVIMCDRCLGAEPAAAEETWLSSARRTAGYDVAFAAGLLVIMAIMAAADPALITTALAAWGR